MMDSLLGLPYQHLASSLSHSDIVTGDDNKKQLIRAQNSGYYIPARVMKYNVTRFL